MGKCYFNPDWLMDAKYSSWLKADHTGDKNKFFCSCCAQAYLIGQSGIKALNNHMLTQKHIKAQASKSGMKSIFNFAKTKSTADSGSYQPSLKVADNQTLEAEVRWALHVVSTHSSGRSSDSISDLFKAMFPDSEIAKKFQCARTKLGYLATFGIAPAIKSSVMAALGEATQFVLFDESLNFDLQKKQLDIHVRFVDVEGQVKTKYVDSFFMGHAKAVDLVKNIRHVTEQVGINKLLQISMDGPNVNQRVFKDFTCVVQEEAGHTLLNIGSCGLHTLHNSFRSGAEASGWEIVDVLSSLYYMFKESPARREDFLKITGSAKLPLKFCGHRWLENVPAAERAIEIWPAILQYFEAMKKGKVDQPSCKSFKNVLAREHDKLLLAKLHCFIFLAKIMRPFLVKFQSNEPLAPFLFSDLSIVKKMYSLVMKMDYVDSIKSCPDVPKDISKAVFLHEHKFNLGCQAENALQKEKAVSPLQIKNLRQGLLQFVKACTTKLIVKSPLKHKFAADIMCFSPDMIVKEGVLAKALFKDVAEHLHNCHWIDAETVDEAGFQFDTLRENLASCTFSSKQRLDEFYREHGGLDSLPSLRRILDIILVLSHGNAEVERGFSVDKEISVENMLEESLISRRLVCQYVRDNGASAAHVPVSKEMLNSASKAWHRYAEALDKKKMDKAKDLESSKRKRQHEEIQDLRSKRRRVELDIDTLMRTVDELNEQAKNASAKEAHELIVKSNATRRNAKEKKVTLSTLSSQIEEKENLLQL